ncbi:MAG TPA: flagellar basal body P-ring formation chaperone FlgA [Planctomycetaceae bacterium]|nr:flagellar basal body P-ring formation chaperone FlgA [Planctomycetaceae bacterium]
MAQVPVARQAIRALLAALAAVTALAWPGAARAALIVLKDAAEVSTSVVQLGQVAEIHGADEKLLERLSTVILAPAPTSGKSKTVDFDTIRTRLASQGFNLAELEFSGSSMVTVSGGRASDEASAGSSTAAVNLAQRRAEELITNGVRQYLRDKAAALGNVQIKLTLSPKQVALLAAAASARIEIYGGAEPWSGQQTFRAVFYERQGRRHEFPVICQVTPLPNVLVPTANLPKGHVVRAEDVSWKQQPVTTAAGTYVDHEEMVVGQETKRSLRAGEPISTVDIRGVPLIRRGDIVSIVARSHGIVVRTDGKALADGSLGQSIKLVSLDGRRELSGRVSGYHEATVGPAAGDLEAAPAAQGNGTGLTLVTADSQNSAGDGANAVPMSAKRRARRPKVHQGGP